MERREAARQDYLERTKREVAERLRSVCSRMPEDEFMKLVEQIAATTVKFSLQRAGDMFSDPNEPTKKPSPDGKPASDGKPVSDGKSSSDGKPSDGEGSGD